MPGLGLHPSFYNFETPGTKTVVPWVNTAPDGVETPAPLTDCRLAAVQSQRVTRGGYSWSRFSISHVQLQQTGNEKCARPGRYASDGVETPTPGSPS